MSVFICWFLWLNIFLYEINHNIVVVLLSIVVVCMFQMFRQLHHAYVDMLCNPFYIPGESISSRFQIVALRVLYSFSLKFHS